MDCWKSPEESARLIEQHLEQRRIVAAAGGDPNVLRLPPQDRLGHSVTETREARRDRRSDLETSKAQGSIGRRSIKGAQGGDHARDGARRATVDRSAVKTKAIDAGA